MLLILLLAGFFGFAAKTLAACQDLVITDVKNMPIDPDTQFVKLQNNSAEDFVFKKETTYLSEIRLVTDGKNHFISIAPGIDKVTAAEFFILTNSKDFSNLRTLHGLGSDIKILHSTFELKESGFVELSCDSGKTTFSKFTFEKKEEPKPEPKIYSNKIIINEIFPKPLNGSEQEEFVELYNSSNQEEGLSGWKLKDRANYTCDLSGNKIGAKDFLVVTEAEIKKLGNKCTIALNDTTGEVLGLYDPQNEKSLSSVTYEGSAKENLSYNFDGSGWRWSQFLTPDNENKFNSPPEAQGKKAKKIYVNTYAEFSAKGSDADKDALKFTWDFGDGHKSYLQKTHHKYEKAGKYKVALKVSDGSEDVFQNFNIEVKKFPKSKITIVSVSPNPKGKDSDLEYITLKNETKKKIDLKDWIIATGSKNLYNHKINGTLVIKPGQTIQVTRKISKFTLNNQESKVELRYPTGKTASKLSYKKVSGGIAEDEIYTKESGAWAWVAPKTINKLAIAEKLAPAEPSSQQGEKPAVLVAYGKNFSEDENSRKNNIENFIQPQGIVLGAYKYKPSFFAYQNEQVYWEIIFAKLNSAINYFLNNFFLKSVP